jgi:hypothetical protein
MSDFDPASEHSASEDDHWSSEPETETKSETKSDGGSDLRLDLLECLDAIETEGNFSSSFHAPAFPNPGLYVKDHGLVGLPLSHADAQAIASLSRQAPFGRKDETVVDTAVRKTWELGAEQFEFKNPRWIAYVQELGRKAIKDLGVKVGAHPEIYKLLLYEEGAFFKAHKDSEKAAGMFGTMVVCLPSHHEGGEIWLSHAGEKRQLSTAATSLFDLSMMSWYADVTHEVKPVTSGYRLVLTYNLIQDTTSQRQTAGLLSQSRKRLLKILNKCNGYLYGDHWAYILDHKYTATNLSLKHLKGRDQAVGQYLHNVCSEAGFYVFLANLTASMQDDDGYYDADEDNNYTRLETVFTTGGHMLAFDVDIKKSEILNQDPFDGSPDSEDEGEFTGNESAPAAYRYHHTVSFVRHQPVTIADSA